MRLLGSRLQRALRRGLEPDGRVYESLEAVRGHPIRSRADVQAIVQALLTVPKESTALASLLEQVDRNSPAHAELAQVGVRQLLRVFDERGIEAWPTPEYLMDVLLVLAMYGGRGGAQRIVEAAKTRSLAEADAGGRWYPILRSLPDGPDRDIVDWPPAGDRIPLWIVRYELDSDSTQGEPESDCGLVGSTTWCFFGRLMDLRPPEDCYAVHCCWELGLYPDEVDDSLVNTLRLIRYRHLSLENAVVTHVLGIPLGVEYPRRTVALASATLEGESGWAVLYGPDSRWHRKVDLPDASHEGKTLLMIHVGRKLLGFDPPLNGTLLRR